MRIDWAMLCNAVEVRDNLFYVLGGTWDTAVAQGIPVMVSGALAVRVSRTVAEAERGAEIAIHVVRIGQDPLPYRAGVGIGPHPLPPDWPPGWEEVHVNAAFPVVGLQVPTFGFYRFELILENEAPYTVPFRVVQAPYTPG